MRVARLDPFILLGSELRFFIVVANTGSLTLASKQLNVAVSAISRRIQILEEKLGLKLFQRHSHGFELTPAGNILKDHVMRNFMAIEETIVQMNDTHQAQKTSIRIACTEGIIYGIISEAISRYHHMDVSMQFQIEVGDTPTIERSVSSGDCDIALLFSRVPTPDISILYSVPAPVYFLMNLDHPLASTDLSIENLVDYPLILTNFNTTLLQLFELTCRLSCVGLKSLIRCNNFAAKFDCLLHIPNAILPCSHLSVLNRMEGSNLIIKEIELETLAMRTFQIQKTKGKKFSRQQNEFISYLVELITIREAEFRGKMRLNIPAAVT